MHNSDQQKTKTNHLSENFNIEHHILSTRSADLYRGYDRKEKENITIWTLRHPLQRNSNSNGLSGPERFITRIQKLIAIEPPIAEILGFGVDVDGVAFAVLPPFIGQPLSLREVDYNEASKRFIECISLVSALHEHGIVCGDLTLNSFWLNRENKVEFVGIMGAFDVEANATSAAPPLDTLHFVSPEQRTGGAYDYASDVFSLGVIGYYLFTIQFPITGSPLISNGMVDFKSLKSIYSLTGGEVFWADKIIQKSLSSDPLKRYSSAVDLLKDLYAMLKDGKHDSLMVEEKDIPKANTSNFQQFDLNKRKRDLEALEKESLLNKPLNNNNDFVSQLKERIAVLLERKKIFLPILAGVLIALFIPLFNKTFNSKSKDEQSLISNLSSLLQNSGNVELKHAFEIVTNPNSPTNEKDAYLKNMVKSESPLVHDFLVKMATTVKNEADKQKIEKAIIDRLLRIKLVRTSQQIQNWLSKDAKKRTPEQYELILRSINPNLTLDSRENFINKVAAFDPNLSIKLISSLCLDSESPDDYQKIMQALLFPKSETSEKDANNNDSNTNLSKEKQLSTMSLILYNEGLTQIFGDEILSKPDTIKDADLPLLLSAFAERNDSRLDNLAKIALSRNMVSPLRQEFLSILKEAKSIPNSVSVALVNSSMGNVSVEDVKQISNWYENLSERALLTIIADNDNEEIILEAFDSVAVKNLNIEPSTSLINEIRNNHWDSRKKFAKAIGLLDYFKIIPQKKLAEYKNNFEALVSDSKLLNITLQKASPEVVKYMMNNYITSVNLATLIDLLSNEQKDVRLLALSQLKSYNDVGVMKFIIEKYRSEKEQDVRKVYKDYFWFIKQREAD